MRRLRTVAGACARFHTRSVRLSRNDLSISASSQSTAPETHGAAWVPDLRVANFLAAAQICLRENVLLHEPLTAVHVKGRLIGHPDTRPVGRGIEVAGSLVPLAVGNAVKLVERAGGPR